VYLFGSGLYYANAICFSQEILKLVEGAEPKINWFVLDAAAITNIDFTGSDTVQQVHQILQKKGVTLLLSNVVDNVQRQFDHYGLTALIGEEHFYDNLAEVLEAYQKETNRMPEEPDSEENITSSAPSNEA
jgi:sulfate permease, SulP family